MSDQSKIKRAIRNTTIVVNSRDRNYMNYPNPNHFRYTLRRPLTNVMSIELMNGSIPSFIFNIQAQWGSFTVVEGGKVFSITLTSGFYTDSTLCTELQKQLNAIAGKQNTYVVAQDPVTRKLTITSTHTVAYSFLFYSGSPKDTVVMNTLTVLSINTPARLLGFGFSDYTSDSSGTINGVTPMDIDNFSNRIYLHLESDGKNLARMELGAGRNDCFHIFYIEPGSNYTFLNKETDHSVFTSSPAPIARMANLEIFIRDEFNRLVDLNHRELNLVFEITHLE